ncbi:hypothetical protein DRE_04633 [Drechslerella stenobrocha 248]|uniref:Uncharacterized protein n=1 Tax=Drechslerella stenobrocha 248 TaxID=1043628 RepID=W7HS90_9PEZI|nr:hypothetical protein DRE_04633 [Drechslerella stenobrocha 248]
MEKLNLHHPPLSRSSTIPLFPIYEKEPESCGFSEPKTPSAEYTESENDIAEVATTNNSTASSVSIDIHKYGKQNEQRQSLTLIGVRPPWRTRSKFSFANGGATDHPTESAVQQNTKSIEVKQPDIYPKPTTSAIPGCNREKEDNRVFPVFPEEFSKMYSKPFVPSHHFISNISQAPAMLEKWKPNFVYAMLENYMMSCDDIDNPACRMRLGQLSVFIPIAMDSGRTAIVGLAPLELFHAEWKGTPNAAPESQDPSITGKVAYDVRIKGRLDSDWTTNRDMVVPTGKIQGAVIGIVGNSCVLRIAPWFLKSHKFNTQSRQVPVLESPVSSKSKVVMYDSTGVFDEHQRELERKRELSSKLSVTSIDGVAESKNPQIRAREAPRQNPGPVGLPKYFSPAALGGEAEPRPEPVRAVWHF